MEAFTVHEGIMAPLDRANVDTDAIIPKQYLKSIRKTGFGPYLFDDWRYRDVGGLDVDVATRREEPGFVLNQAAYRNASILLARDNFGCGSSREHAVWALADFGFRCVIAPSFADIFYNNCFKNGVLPVVMEKEIVDSLFETAFQKSGASARVDLHSQTVEYDGGEKAHFEIEPQRRENLMEGLDDIGETLQHANSIAAFEADRSRHKPWIFKDL